MATHTDGNFLSREAAADLSAKQYYAVKTDANGKIVLAAAATDNILGVLANAPKLGETADVALVNGNGTFKGVAGAGIAKDALLTTDGAGKLITATQTTAGQQPTVRVIGRALAAVNSGDTFEYRKADFLY